MKLQLVEKNKRYECHITPCTMLQALNLFDRFVHARPVWQNSIIWRAYLPISEFEVYLATEDESLY